MTGAPAGGRRMRVDLGTGQVAPVRHAPQAPPALAALEVLVDAARATGGARAAGDLPVTFAAGELAGAGAPGTDRVALIGVSPRNGRVAEARAEGPFGAAMRAAGLDLLTLDGHAPSPVYVLVEHGRPRLLPARDLWGRPPRDVTEVLQARHGPTSAVAVIGAAGERGLGAAAVLVCGDHALARYGLGGVLGAKRVKAVVHAPGPAPGPVDPAATRRVALAYEAAMGVNPLTRSQAEPPGFAGWVTTDLPPGHLGRRNFRDTASAGSAFPGDHLQDLLVRGTGRCPSCPTDCMKSFRAGTDEVTLHQEWLAALGPGIGPSTLGEAVAAVRHCLDLGLDPVAAGGAIAAAREGGADHPLRDLLVAAAGEEPPGVPRDLARALTAGADAVGTLLGVPAMTVDGHELPPFDPRVQAGLGLALAVAPAGPRYDVCEHDLDFDPVHGMPHAYAEATHLGLGAPAPAPLLDEARVDRTARLMLLWSGLDALGLCPFASTPTRPLDVDAVCELVRAVCGRELDLDGLLALGRRRFRLQGEVNAALGRPGGARALPARLHDEPVLEGPFAGARVADAPTFAAAAARLAAAIGLAPEPAPVGDHGTRRRQ